MEKTNYLDELNSVIQNFLEENYARAVTMSPFFEALWREIGNLLGRGGKRIRPRLIVLTYQAFGGKDVTPILPIAVAQELLHLGMLIHDDIIDRDYIRYGIDNIAGAYNKSYKPYVANDTDRLHYADSAAILAGDLMLTGAYGLILSSGIEAELKLEVQQIFSEGMYGVIGGEFIDTESSFRELGQIKAETVALYKTASYTYVAPMLIGAVLAGASAQDQEYVRIFAENIGIAFQLQDDILGVFGDETEMGKSTIGDIREGKRTYMIEQFYEVASKEDKDIFDQYFGNPSFTSDNISEAKDILVRSGAKKLTEDAISRYESKAREALNNLNLDEQFMKEYEDVILIATKRSK